MHRSHFHRLRLLVGTPLFLIVSAILMTPASFSATPAAKQPGYDRPGAFPHQSRSVTLATRGMVATSHPQAAIAGLDILKRGGNAVDAAIAVNAMLNVVEPMSCGIGGDVFVIYWDNKTQKLYGLNGSGRSPYDISREKLRQRSVNQLPNDGVLSWSVPGCVAGWDDLRQRFGTMPFETTLADAIETAEHGFPVSQVIASYWKGGEQGLRKYPDSASTFLVDGRAPREGEVFRNPKLAATFKRIAEKGRDGFYQGHVAEQIIQASEQLNGYFSLRDLADHKSDWIEPVSTNYRGYDVWELPPNGQGIAALQMLNLLEPYDLKQLGPTSAEYWHLFVEAKKLAFADRARFYADPDFNQLPTSELISKPYAARQGKRIDPNQAAVNVPAGDPKLTHGDTVYLTVVDKDRNCCSFIQSNYYGFGSKVTPGDVGFVMQNRGALFAMDDKHLNRLEPHKRPFHTIIPAMVTKDNRPVFSFGVMGGDMQPQGHVQVLVNIIDFDMNIQAAGDAARVRHMGSETPTGIAANGGGTVTVESGISPEVRNALKAMGHEVTRGSGGFGGYQGIWIDWANGTLQGASEPRKDGAAVGY